MAIKAFCNNQQVIFVFFLSVNFFFYYMDTRFDVGRQSNLKRVFTLIITYSKNNFELFLMSGVWKVNKNIKNDHKR